MKTSASLRLKKVFSRSPRKAAYSTAFAAVVAFTLAFASCEQESLPPAEPYSETAGAELEKDSGTGGETVPADLVFTNLSDDFDYNPNRGTLAAIVDEAADSSYQHARPSVIVQEAASAQYRWEVLFEPAVISWIHASFDASAAGSASSRARWTLSWTPDGIIWNELASADVPGTQKLANPTNPDSAYRLFTTAASAEYTKADDWLDSEGNPIISATEISGLRLDLEAACEAAEATEENPAPLAGSIGLICGELRPVFP